MVAMDSALNILFVVFYLLPLLALAAWIFLELKGKSIWARLIAGSLCMFLVGYFSVGFVKKQSHARNSVQISIINEITEVCSSGCSADEIYKIKAVYGY